MTLTASKEHCRFCFDTLQTQLWKSDPPTPTFDQTPSAPLFVTWNKTLVSHDSTETDGIEETAEGLKKLPDYPEETFDLRGCIGCFSPLPVTDGLKKYALHAALNDSRFSAIKKEELPSLKVAVSFLVNFVENKKVYDWEVGKHGILIEFTADSQRGGKEAFNGTYLPEVASEQNWSKEEAIKSLVRKAGYRGSVDEALLEKISLTTYESTKCSLTYKEWKLMTV